MEPGKPRSSFYDLSWGRANGKLKAMHDAAPPADPAVALFVRALQRALPVVTQTLGAHATEAQLRNLAETRPDQDALLILRLVHVLMERCPAQLMLECSR